MPTKTLEQLKDAMPTCGVEMEQLEALLPEIFAVAQSGNEKPFDVADLFREAISRAAENRQRVSPETEQTIFAWVKSHWATSPANYFEKLCAILVNLKSDQARIFLEAQEAAATDKKIKSYLTYSLRNRTPTNPVA